MTAQGYELDAPPPDLSGTVLMDKWRLLRRIGEGGMGMVYAAEALDQPGSKYAIKILSQEFLSDPNVLSRFLEEGRTYRLLVHPNILKVYGTHQAPDGAPFLVMELLEGLPLSAYTKGGARLPPAQAATILQGMLAALSAAHTHGVVHRDLKPDNVFLARDQAGQFQVKLLDFGIAKVIDAAGGMGKKTSSGMMLGTPAYMSPEQIRSSKDVDARSDLFAVGVLFYEMLSGTHPFPAPNEFARLTAVLAEDPPPLEKVDPSLAAFGPFLARALQKERDQRYQSANEMARELAALMGAEQPASRIHAPPLDGLPAGAAAPETRAPQTGRSPSSNYPPAPGGSAARGYNTAPVAIMEAGTSPRPQGSTGNTLTSRPGQHTGERPPQVEVVAMDPSYARRRVGVAPWLVVILVIGGILAGILIGFGLGRR